MVKEGELTLEASGIHSRHEGIHSRHEGIHSRHALLPSFINEYLVEETGACLGGMELKLICCKKHNWILMGITTY